MLRSAQMRAVCLAVAVCLISLVGLAAPVVAQSTTGTIQGVVRDDQAAVIPGATVTVRNVLTGQSRSVVSGESGQYRFPNLQVGEYELTVELAGFGDLQAVGPEPGAEPGRGNRRDAAAGRRGRVGAGDGGHAAAEHDQRRGRGPLRHAARGRTAGGQQPGHLLAGPAGAWRVAARGGADRLRVRAPTSRSTACACARTTSCSTGRTATTRAWPAGSSRMNNTDVVQEVRLITNQFAAEYGRAAGSVMNVITKSGTNQFRGSAFLFHNDNSLNARSNLDKAAGRDEAPFYREQQYGGTVGGPVLRNRTFFFGSYQNWTQDQLGSGTTLNGAPTEAGRRILESVAGTRPQVAALLQLPAGGADAARTHRAVDGQRPDLRHADRVADRLGGRRVRQPPGIGAHRSAVRRQRQPRRPLHDQRQRLGRHRPGDAAGPDHAQPDAAALVHRLVDEGLLVQPSSTSSASATRSSTRRRRRPIRRRRRFRRSRCRSWA